jgi:hypothetical protein
MGLYGDESTLPGDANANEALLGFFRGHLGE